MPHIDHSGPEGDGPRMGRKLGRCSNDDDGTTDLEKLGKGMGLRRNSGGGTGKGKRLKYYQSKK